MKKNSWGLLVIAFLMAVILWIFVVEEDNPQVEINLGKIAVEVLNEDVMYDNNLAYEITNNIEVSVIVTVPQADGWKVSASDINLTADLSNWHPGFASVPIDVEIVKNSSLIKKYTLSETVLKIETETMEEKELDVCVQVSGTPKEGYVVSETKTTPETITVKAPSSEMKRIVSAQVDVEVDGFMRNYTAKKPIVLYDGNNDVIDLEKEQIILSEDTVEVKLTVLQEKEVSIELPSITDCKDGYRCVSLTSSVDKVRVLGIEKKIQGISSISLSGEKIDLKDAKTDVKVTYTLQDYLPKGIHLASDEPTSVDVVAKIEKLSQKVFTVSSSNIQVDKLSSQRSVTFVDKSIQIVVWGLEEDLAKITVEELNPTINLEKCSLGKQEVEIGVALPNELELVEIPKITIEVLKS
jgi:YbbR domain-containing protein